MILLLVEVLTRRFGPRRRMVTRIGHFQRGTMNGYTHSDLSLVRTFEAVASLKSFSEAARSLGVSQSTVSEHVRLLEEKVRTTLVSRTTRQMSLTPAGEAMQVYARSLLSVSDQIAWHFAQPSPTAPFRLGVAEDIAFSRLSSLLRLFKGCFPELELSVRTGVTVDLIHQLEAQTLDMVVGKQRIGQRGGRILWTNRTVWVGHGDVVLPAEDPVPLLFVLAPSLLRSIALEALTQQGRAYRILLETNSFTALRAAFELQHGVTVGLADHLPDFVRPLPDNFSLPALPSVEVFAAHRSGTIPAASKAIATFLEDALVQRTSSKTNCPSDLDSRAKNLGFIEEPI